MPQGKPFPQLKRPGPLQGKAAAGRSGKSPFSSQELQSAGRFHECVEDRSQSILPAPRRGPTRQYCGGSEGPFGRQVDRHSNSRLDRIRPEPRIELLNKITLHASGLRPLEHCHFLSAHFNRRRTRPATPRIRVLLRRSTDPPRLQAESDSRYPSGSRSWS